VLGGRPLAAMWAAARTVGDSGGWEVEAAMWRMAVAREGGRMLVREGRGWRKPVAAVGETVATRVGFQGMKAMILGGRWWISGVGVMERGKMEWWEDGMLPGGVGELVTVVYAVLFDGVPFTEEPVLGNEASAGPGLFVFGEDVLDDVGVVEDVVVACCDDLTGVSDLWVCLVRGDIPEIDCKR